LKREPAKSASSSRVERAPAPVARIDLALASVPILLALMLMTVGVSRRGAELMPWPDGLEYAAQAVNINSGRGGVLHFGGYSYPARYPEGYSLILAAAYPLIGRAPENLYRVTIAIGLAAVGLLYLLSLRVCADRWAAIAASAMLGFSPVFVTDSTLVLSDVPALALAIAAALAIASATESEGSARCWTCAAWWVGFAFLAGFEVTIRQTNFALAIAGIAGLLLVRNQSESTATGNAGRLTFAASLIAFAMMPAWQALRNWRDLGSPFASGYVFWVPEVYGSLNRTFNARFLFGPTMPRNPIGNAAIYGPALLGFDGLVLASMGDRSGPLYSLYPAAGAVFAAIGMVRVLQGNLRKSGSRVVCFGLLFLGILCVIYLLYFFTDPVFLLPASFVLFLLAGLGIARANRAAFAARGARTSKGLSKLGVVGVFILDLVLAVSIVGEVANRCASARSVSQAVPALRQIAAHIEPQAVVISNVSLQFLELYVDGADRRFVGLHSFESDSDFSDYHLARLYAKAANGWGGELPSVMFRDRTRQQSTFDLVAGEIKRGRFAYLLIFPPQSAQYDQTLRQELDQLSADFEVAEQERAGSLVLFRLEPR
jgi:4-amino-4-deoxy-L-arabinose transferase-like glycosyltransferase